MSLNGLPENWEVKKLGDVCSFHYGKGLTKKHRNEMGTYDVYGSNGVVGQNSEFLVGEPCIIVGRKGAAGEVHLSTNPSWPIDTTYFVKKPASFDLKFLFYQLRTLRLASLEKSTAIPGLNRNDAYERNVVIPPIDEQERIVAKIEELFSELDAGVESLKKAQAQLKTYRQAVLKSAFEGKLTNENLPDGELPKGWKRMTLGEVASSVEYGSAAKSEKSGKIPVLRMGNIQNGRFDWSDLVFTNDDDEIEKYRLKKNDVLFNRTNSPEWVGKTAIYKGERPAIFAGYLIRINRVETLIDSNYLTYFLNSHEAKIYGNSVKTFGVNQANINGTKLKTYPLNICPLGEQHRVVEEIESRLSVCDKLEETITASLKQSEALRQSILKQAFEGKLVKQESVAVYKPKNVNFYRMQVVGQMLVGFRIHGLSFGEVGCAKTTYLLEKIFAIPIFKDYKKWHWGPFTSELKKTLGSKYFKVGRNKAIKVLDESNLLKYSHPFKERIDAGVEELTEVFNRYTDSKVRLHKIELLATVCKVIEDIQTTDLYETRQSMKDWSIEWPGIEFKNKAEKFDESETKKCIAFIIDKGWDKRLIQTDG